MANEPTWLAERRKASAAAFDKLPLPTRQDEDYRRSDLRRLDLNAFTPDGTKAPELSGAPEGVIVSTLAEAAERHPELVRPYLEDDRVGADEDKWSAMNGAHWKHGVFVYDHYLESGRTFHGGPTTVPLIRVVNKPVRRTAVTSDE